MLPNLKTFLSINQGKTNALYDSDNAIIKRFINVYMRNYILLILLMRYNWHTSCVHTSDVKCAFSLLKDVNEHIFYQAKVSKSNKTD